MSDPIPDPIPVADNSPDHHFRRCCYVAGRLHTSILAIFDYKMLALQIMQQLRAPDSQLSLSHARDDLRAYNLEINGSQPVLLLQSTEQPEYTHEHIVALATHYSRTAELPSGWKILDTEIIAQLLQQQLRDGQMDVSVTQQGDHPNQLHFTTRSSVSFLVYLARYVSGRNSPIQDDGGGNAENLPDQDQNLNAGAAAGGAGLDDTGGASCW